MVMVTVVMVSMVMVSMVMVSMMMVLMVMAIMNIVSPDTSIDCFLMLILCPCLEQQISYMCRIFCILTVNKTIVLPIFIAKDRRSLGELFNYLVEINVDHDFSVLCKVE